MVVIPCLNEAGTIGAVVTGVRRHVPAVLVVDDGSTDQTGCRAREAGARVLRHDHNRGKGSALATGLRQALADGFEIAITMDGDGQHDPEDLPAFLKEGRGGGDLIVGNRMSAVGNMPRLRRWVNRWMSRRLSRRTGRDLPDTQCGYRLIPLAVWNQLVLVSEHFEIESEMILTFLRAGLRVRFIPVRTIYKTEQSKIHPIRDTIRWFRWWWRREGK